MKYKAIHRDRVVLIVEDESALRAAMALALDLNGFNVLTANDGLHGLNKLSETIPDLIISDFMMPRMNGGDMIKHIRENPSYDSVPILLMSAALPDNIDPSIADTFLPKPVTMAHLLQSAAHLLGDN